MSNPLTGKRILVVEDEMMVLIMIENALADLGCESVSSAATVDQALQFLETDIFDAATLDVNLNGTLSYRVAEALKARGVPFAFSTGYTDHGIGGAHDGQPVLSKPYSLEDLKRMFAILLPAAAASAAS